MILQYHFLTKTSQKTTRAFTVIYPKWIEDLGFLIDEMIWSIAVIKSLSCLKIRLRWFAIDTRFFFAMAGVDWRYFGTTPGHWIASFSQQNRVCYVICSAHFDVPGVFDLSWCYCKSKTGTYAYTAHTHIPELRLPTWLETYSKLGSQRTNCSHDVMSIAIIIVNLILNQN